MYKKIQKRSSTKTYRMNEKRTAQFVSLYKQHESLWNIFLPQYRNRDARTAMMQEIVNEMNIDGFTVDQFPNKVKSLRCTYYLELEKIERSKRSGDGGRVYEPNLPWFKDMKYIMNVINTTRGVETDNKWSVESNSNTQQESSDTENPSENLIEIKTEDVDTASVTDDDPFSSPNLRKCNSISDNTKKPKNIATTITAAVKELHDLNILLNTPTPSQCETSIIEEECDIMGKQIAMQLRNLPEEMRLQANFEIQRILMEARIKNLKNK